MQLSEKEILEVVKEFGSKALYNALYNKYKKHRYIGYVSNNTLYFDDDLTWNQTKMLLKVLNKVYSNSISHCREDLLKQWEEQQTEKKTKEKLSRTDFLAIFETAWSSSCRHDSSYIESVGVKRALQEEWESLQDGLQEDYSFRRWKMSLAEKKKYLNYVY